jgi:hypothetical protein
MSPLLFLFNTAGTAVITVKVIILKTAHMKFNTYG